MDFLDLLFPLLILLGPAIFKSFSQKKKTEEKNARKSSTNKNDQATKKEDVKNIPNYYDRFERKPKSMEERKLKTKKTRMDEEKHIKEEEHIGEERYIKEEKRITEEERIKELKRKREIYANSEKKLSRNKKIRNKIDEEEIISDRNRSRKRNVDLDYIKQEEIGRDDIDLRFDKTQLVQGIILSEVLSKPKALEKKK